MSQLAVPQTPHPCTFVAVDPASQQRSLLAEVHPEVDDEPPPTHLLRDFERRLFERNIRVGLFVTRASTVVVRDLLSEMDFDANTYERTATSTPTLFQAAGLPAPVGDEQFVRHVRTWLEAVAASWHSFLPDDAVAIMVPEVVGNLAEADFEVWNGVLDSSDARG